MSPDVNVGGETAVSATKLKNSIGYFAAFVALGIVLSSLGPSLPFLADNLGVTLAQASYLITGRAFGYLLGSLLGGWLYDRLPGHPVLVGTLLALALLLTAVPIIPLLWLMVLIMLLIGLGQGTLDVGGNVQLVWVHGKDVGPFMNGLHFFAGVGAFISPIVVTQMILRSGSLQPAYWLFAVLMLPPAVWLWWQPSPSAPVVDAETAVLPIRWGLVAAFAFFFFLYVGAEASFGGWIFSYVRALEMSDGQAGWLTSAFWMAITAGRLLMIPVLGRVRPARILHGCLLGALAGLLLLGWGAFVGETAVILGTILAGFSMASVFPTTLALAERKMALSGRVTGFMFSGASLGAMVVPWLIGRYLEVRGPLVFIVFLLGALLLALGVLLLIGRSERRAMVSEGGIS